VMKLLKGKKKKKKKQKQKKKKKKRELEAQRNQNQQIASTTLLFEQRAKRKFLKAKHISCFIFGTLLLDFFSFLFFFFFFFFSFSFSFSVFGCIVYLSFPFWERLISPFFSSVSFLFLDQSATFHNLIKNWAHL